MRTGLAVVLVVASCRSFEPPPAPNDAQDGVPVVGFELAMSGADEKSGSVNVDVVLVPASPTPVAVTFAVTGGSTATPGVDFTVATASLTFDPGETRKPISVEIVDDSDEAEADELIELTLSDPDGAALADPRTHAITISNHILPRAQFAAVTSTTNEAAQTMLMITLDKPAEVDGSIKVAIAGSGTPNLDYMIDDGATIAILAGQQSAMIPIGEIDDLHDEDDEPVTFTLMTPSSGLLVGALAMTTHTITDNDPPSTVSFTTATSSVSEGAGTGTIGVSLTTVSGKTITVSLAIDAISSASPNDATIGGTTVTFAPGVILQLFPVTIVDDAADESNETVILNLANPTNATLGVSSQHTQTIVDNE